MNILADILTVIGAAALVLGALVVALKAIDSRERGKRDDRANREPPPYV